MITQSMHSEKNTTTGDAGIELSYNKRNRIRTGLRWKDLQNLDPTLKINEAKKAKIYPRPDYEKLVANGMHPLVAHIVKQAYDAISVEVVTRNAPSDEDLEKYIESIHQYMEGVLNWAENKTLSNEWMREISRQAERNFSALKGKLTALNDLTSQKPLTLLQVVYGENWRDHIASIRIIGGNKALSALRPSLDDAARAMKDINKGWPGKLESWQKQGYRIANGDSIEIELNEGSKKINADQIDRYVTAWVCIKEGTRQFHIEMERFNVASKSDPVVVAFTEEKIRTLRGKELLLNKSDKLIAAFENVEDAKTHAREMTKRSKQNSSIDEKGCSVENAQRIGPEFRKNNRDISSEELIETFGFKGINFGNWMKGKSNDAERQLHLNHIYDSFMDLSKLMGTSPRSMSLGGMLGIAVGAQGNGQHAAHFVPGLNELNITRTAGAGLISHEWGHAFDHHLARIAGLERQSAPYISENVEIQHALRSEVNDAFQAVIRAMNERPMTSEDIALKKSKDVEKGNKFIASWLKGIRQEFDGHIPPKENEEHPLSALFLKVKLGEYGEFIPGRYFPVVDDIRQLFKSFTKKNMSTKLATGLQNNLNYMRRVLLATNTDAKCAVMMTHTLYVENASKLDLDKGGKPYWNTNCEKFARAFDAYISDALESKGLINSYLSLAGREDETTPNGEERILINSKIKNLVDLVCNVELRHDAPEKTAGITSEVETNLAEELENSPRQKLLF